MPSLRIQPKMRTFLLFNLKEFGMETYITKIEIPTIWKAISKYRLSGHKLKIGIQSYQRPKLSPDQRICIKCRVTEDEPHCIMRFKSNKLEREKIFAKVPPHNKCFNNVNETVKFIFLQQSDQICDRIIFQFICLENSSSQNETT